MSSEWKFEIEKTSETIASRIFRVKVRSEKDSHEFNVEVDKDYAIALFGREVPLIVLVQQSFLLLLEREPVTSILRDFNLKEISRYFPEYEDAMRALFT